MMLSDELGQLIQDISHRREEIKKEYVKAWLASTLSTTNVNIDDLIQRVHLVEKWDSGRTKVSWYMEYKK